MNSAETTTPVKVPLLSIAIPSFNRAHWLRFILPLWLEQAAEFPDECEVVISDNASEDDTPQVLEAMKSLGPLRFVRNESNIGGGPNLYRVVTELARGEYILAVGDDDFPMPGAIRRILEAIRTNPGIEYLYANYGFFDTGGPPVERLMSDIFVEAACPLRDFEPRRVERLAEIAGLDMNCFTPMGCSIFQRAHAMKAFQGHAGGVEFTSAYSVSSHALYVAENLLQKPAYFSGHPWVILSSNSTWSEFQAIFALKILPDVMDAFEAHGADEARIAELRRLAIKQAMPLMAQSIGNRCIKHRNHFSVRGYIWRHRRYGQIWIALMRALIRARRSR